MRYGRPRYAQRTPDGVEADQRIRALASEVLKVRPPHQRGIGTSAGIPEPRPPSSRGSASVAAELDARLVPQSNPLRGPATGCRWSSSRALVLPRSAAATLCAVALKVARGIGWFGIGLVALAWTLIGVLSFGSSGPTLWHTTCYAPTTPVASLSQAAVAAVGLALLVRAAFSARRRKPTRRWLVASGAVLLVWVLFVMFVAPDPGVLPVEECYRHLDLTACTSDGGAGASV